LTLLLTHIHHLLPCSYLLQIASVGSSSANPGAETWSTERYPPQALVLPWRSHRRCLPMLSTPGTSVLPPLSPSLTGWSLTSILPHSSNLQHCHQSIGEEKIL
jgi:hypothetical protein